MSALCEPAMPVVEMDDAQACAEAELVISSLEAGRSATTERRGSGRRSLRGRGELRLFADGESPHPRVVFARDADAHGLGFVSREQLPLGFRGRVTLDAVDLDVAATVYRCRPCAAGWYEGVLYFQRPIPTLHP